MEKNTLRKAFHTAKDANSILTKAGSKMLKTSIETAKDIGTLYKEAGHKSLNLSKDVLNKTWKLTITNQKELIKTSVSAVKEVVNSIKNQKENGKISQNGRRKRKTEMKRVKSKDEITIDDMLN